MFRLETTPYSLEEEPAREILVRLRAIEERIQLLRRLGTLSPKTIQDYYGQKRFEQVAESNAIEGSTLSVGETELAVLKGVTITGHDPAYVRDAIALDKALLRVVEIAKDAASPTNIGRIQEIHSLILGDRSGAGVFRSEPVTIRGSNHTPPKTWREVMAAMEKWEAWSLANGDAPAPLRAAILHAWLTHIHPFIDGNGRIARAIGNLELIRAGYPPVIIKKKERDRYIDALGESDDGGDIRAFIELVFDRVDGSLTGLEGAARKVQGYSPSVERILKQQEQQLQIWSTGVKLLASVVEHRLTRSLEPVRGTCFIKVFDTFMDLDDFVDLCAGRNISESWAFIISLEVPGLTKLEKLAWIGHRSSKMYNRLQQEGGPSLFWSRKNPGGFPKWTRDAASSPFAVEMTSKLGKGDEWVVAFADDSFTEIQTTELAIKIADALLGQIGV